MKPIEQPNSLLIRFAYFIARRRFGKVIAPLKTIYSRRPPLLWFSLRIERRMKRTIFSHQLAVMLRSLVAIERDCGFCIDIGRYEMLDAGVSPEKANALWDFAQSPHFSEKERAALDYAHCLVHEPAGARQYREKLAAFYTEKEIIDIAWVCAAESYYNVLNKGLGLESDQLCALKGMPEFKST